MKSKTKTKKTCFQLSLNKWIERVGLNALAKNLKVQPGTIRHWKRGHCLPNVRQMQVIKKLSKGSVTYDLIIDGRKK